MADFQKAILVVLAHEGGLADDKDDPGGITNFGITIPWLSDFEKGVTPETIRTMTKDQAIKRYRTYLWNPFGMDRITDDTVACKIFDAAVQFGEGSDNRPGHEGAPALAQLSANFLGANLLVDGHFGPKTAWAINQLDPVKYVDAFCGLMLARYRASVQRNPKLKKFLDGGWAQRAAWPKGAYGSQAA
jgi:type VI secretion system secreted protein VgrG